MRKLTASAAIVILFFFYSFIKKDQATEVATPPRQIPKLEDTNTPAPTGGSEANSPAPSPTSPQKGQYRDGDYTGSTINGFYGNVQVKAFVRGGQVVEVQFLKYPNDRSTSIEINSQAMPMLRSEAIQVQNAKVDIISGATDTSLSFIDSLDSALSQAK